LSAGFGQNVPLQHPIEEQYHISYWWWLLGVVIVIAIGIALYMVLKKNPRKDAY
jgi:Mg2+ and Co2+ transporter CorA